MNTALQTWKTTAPCKSSAVNFRCRRLQGWDELACPGRGLDTILQICAKGGIHLEGRITSSIGGCKLDIYCSNPLPINMSILHNIYCPKNTPFYHQHMVCWRQRTFFAPSIVVLESQCQVQRPFELVMPSGGSRAVTDREGARWNREG